MINKNGTWEFKNREEYKKVKQMDREQMRSYMQKQFDLGYLHGTSAAMKGIDEAQAQVIALVNKTLYETLTESKGIGDKRKAAILELFADKIAQAAEVDNE